MVLREFYNAFAGAFLEHDYKRRFGGGTYSVIQALSDEELEDLALFCGRTTQGTVSGGAKYP